MAFIGVKFSFGIFLGSPAGFFLVMPPWLAPLEVLMWGFLLWIFLLGIPMPPCVYFLVLLVGYLILGSIVRKLNPVWHELLHMWRTFVACWFFWGKHYCVWYSFWSCFRDVCLMASVVYHLWFYVTAVFSMWYPWWSIIWPIVNYHSCPWWSSRCAVVIKFSKYVGLGW